MMPYDQYGNAVDRKKVKRYRERNLTPWKTVTAAVALVAITIGVLWAMTRKPQSNNEAAKRGPRHDSMCVTYTYNGEAIRYYVMTDPDTQRQYIVNDRGGMVLREKRDTPYPETSEKYRNGTKDEETNDETQQRGTVVE